MPVFRMVRIGSVAANGALEIGPNLRVGATLSGTVTGTSPQTTTISAAGDIAVGDTVYHDIAATVPVAATQYTIDAIGGGNVTVSWTGGGSRTITSGKILSPANHSGGVVRLHGYQVSSPTNAAAHQFKSGLTALTGVESLVLGTPASHRVSRIPICKTAPGEVLYVAPTTGVLSGWAVYSFR